jgi:hypothetical protein
VRVLDRKTGKVSLLSITEALALGKRHSRPTGPWEWADDPSIDEPIYEAGVDAGTVGPGIRQDWTSATQEALNLLKPEPTPDERISAAIFAYREQVPSPETIERGCGARALDCLPCGRPFAKIPTASPDRCNEKSELWKIGQSLARAGGPIVTSGGTTFVYFQTFRIVRPPDLVADPRAVREHLSREVGRVQGKLTPFHRALSEEGYAGDAIVWLWPDRIDVLEVTDAPTKVVDRARGKLLGPWIHDLTVEAPADAQDVPRWFEAILDRAHCRFEPPQGEERAWWTSSLLRSQAKTCRPWGRALVESYTPPPTTAAERATPSGAAPSGFGGSSGDSEFVPGRQCEAAALLHPNFPVVEFRKVVTTRRTNVSGWNPTLEELQELHTVEAMERLGSVGRRIDQLSTAIGWPPPVET